ncbi:hypothetical protein I4U23_021995, partial [Adineta vaga]
NKTVSTINNNNQNIHNITNQYKNTILQRSMQKYGSHTNIHLDSQNVTDQDMEFVVREAIIKNRCPGLSLASNNITAAGIWILAQALINNCSLKTLILHGNQIGDEGLSFLVNVLINNKTIIQLNIGNNNLTDESVKYLVQMIKTNKSLTNLWLCKNKISNIGVQILADAIVNHNKTLRFLSLNENILLTDGSIDSLIQMIKYGRSLVYLYLSYCNFSPTGKERLEQAHQSRPHLKLDIR